MPVHRHVHAKRGSVYALPEELDGWIQSRRLRGEEPEKKPETEIPSTVPNGDAPAAPRRSRPWLAVPVILSICLAGAGWLLFRHRAAASVQPRIRSLAVLPLGNLSGDPSQDYLADGITEAVIGRLSNIHDLRVISRTSVMRFKNTQISLPEIARTLGVDAIVEGSVIREGDRIRVTTQLIRGATDEHFWSETYDREMRDALTLESALAQSIAEKVEVTVTGEEHLRLSSSHAVAPEVYESYLKGMSLLGEQENQERGEQSIAYFDDAIRRDPGFAPAYLGLANAYAMIGTVFYGRSPEQNRPKVISFAQKALQLDPDLVGAHVTLAFVLQEEWRWTEAEGEYKRALELNMNSAEAHGGFAGWLLSQGRTKEALDQMEYARALDPEGVSGGEISWILFQARRFDDAIREANSALAVHPDNNVGRLFLAFALIANNRPADAIPVLERGVSLTAMSPAALGVLVRAYAHAGRRSDALRCLAELQRRSKEGYVPTAAFVNAYLGLGDKEETFYWLERAYKEQSAMLQHLKTHPYFDPIRGDPRFDNLVRRVGLN
jgi:TolB-like protein/Tfp pilus assembly protein PilF